MRGGIGVDVSSVGETKHYSSLPTSLLPPRETNAEVILLWIVMSMWEHERRDWCRR